MHSIATFFSTYPVHILVALIGIGYFLAARKNRFFPPERPVLFLPQAPAIAPVGTLTLILMLLSWLAVVALANILPLIPAIGDPALHIPLGPKSAVTIPLTRLLILVDIGYVWFWLKRLGMTWAHLGLRRIPFRLGLLWTLASGMHLLLAYGEATFRHRIDFPAFWHLLAPLSFAHWMSILIILVVSLIPDMIIEEVVCRGLFFSAFRSRWNTAAAWILQAVVFGLSHYMVQHDVVAAMVPGLMFGLGMLATGSLLPGLVAHTLFDLQGFLADVIHIH